MTALLARLRSTLGTSMLAALLVLGAGVVFLVLVVRPLEQRAATLERETAGALRRLPAGGAIRVGQSSGEARLAAFYAHFERTEDSVDWLARLHGLARAQGLEPRSADYRLEESRHKLERYQVTLPITGGYAQIRAFLEAALAECPVLSLDQVTFRRRSGGESRVDAEVVLTLYLARR